MPQIDSIVEVIDEDNIRTVRLNRPHKRNALAEKTFQLLHRAFVEVPDEVRAIILCGSGSDFCAGLDLSEHRFREPFPSVIFARYGHAVFNAIQFGGKPVIAALHGAVIGGGLEMACCSHVRVAEQTTFYQLPEARRGIFIGGGGSVRISRIIGQGRLVEMMLTGRTLDAAAGERLGLSHYLVEAGGALSMAKQLAHTIAQNSVISNYLITQALPKISDMSSEEGLLAESLAQALTLTSPDAKRGIEAFLNRKAAMA
jgi:(methylthio)acryloyl-CoA hydratase